MLALKLGNSLVSSENTSSSLYAINLDGTDEYASADSVSSDINTATGTYSVWVKVKSHSANGFIMQSRADTNNQITVFFHNANSEVRFIYRGGGDSTVIAITDNIENDGNWHHIAATWNTSSNSLVIYLDGVSKDSSSSTLTAFSGSPSLFDIGQNTADAGFFNGDVSNAAVFNQEVAITDLYLANEPPLNLSGLSGLVGYWKFNEGAGSTAFDSSGEGNNATLFNSPTWITDVP
jgi:hypothetical protein